MENQTVELQEKLITVNRVVKVVKGGRIFSFTALTVVGDKNGKVGYGKGKAREISVAIKKARETARKNMINVLMKEGTIFYPVKRRQNSVTVIMVPASKGTGLIAGLAMRAVLELAGFSDVLTKVHGSTNPFNVVRATYEGLKNMKSVEYIAAKRSKSVEEILN